MLCLDVLNHQTNFEEYISEAIRISSKVAIFSFFKPFEKNPRIEQRREKLIYHFFSKEGIEEWLNSLKLRYSWNPSYDGDRSPHLFVYKHEKE